MRDQHIRAALEAAVSAVEARFGPGDSEDRQILAAAIAAFLRALPDQYSRGGAGFWDAIPPNEETRLWLAAAVEQEARGDA
jgi:hypothetical protein